MLDGVMVDKLGSMAEARRLELYEVEKSAVKTDKAKLVRNRFEAVDVPTPLKLLSKYFVDKNPGVNPWDHITPTL